MAKRKDKEKDNNVNIEDSNVKKEKKKLKVNLSDDTPIIVKNNTAGRLIYINHRTGDEFEWDTLDSEQELTLADLKAMKAKQLSFFKNRWIDIVDVPDLEKPFTIADVYALLRVYKYYEELGIDFDISDLLLSDTKTIKNKIKGMSKSLKNTLIVVANDMILDGSLDSISKIKELEDILKVELARKDDE